MTERSYGHFIRSLLGLVGVGVFFAAIRYSWLQYNSGVRYLVPAVPLLFLLVAGALVTLIHSLARLTEERRA